MSRGLFRVLTLSIVGSLSQCSSPGTTDTVANGEHWRVNTVSYLGVTIKTPESFKVQHHQDAGIFTAIEKVDSTVSKASLTLSRYQILGDYIDLSRVAHEMDSTLTGCEERLISGENVLICRRTLVRSGITIRVLQGFTLRLNSMYVLNLFSAQEMSERFITILESIKVDDQRK